MFSVRENIYGNMRMYSNGYLVIELVRFIIFDAEEYEGLPVTRNTRTMAEIEDSEYLYITDYNNTWYTSLTNYTLIDCAIVSESGSCLLGTAASDPMTDIENGAVEPTGATDALPRSPKHTTTVPRESIASPKQIQLPSFNFHEDDLDNGYDTDGQIGPFNDCIELEGEQDFEEDSNIPVLEVLGRGDTDDETNDIVVAVEVINEESTVVNDPLEHVPIEDGVLMKMSKPDLQENLRSRGQRVSGNKGELQKRLKDTLRKKIPVGFSLQKKSESKSSKNKGGGDEQRETGMKTFSKTAHWKILTPDEIPAEEPANPNFSTPRAPTIDGKDAAHVPLKYNFSDKIDRPIFTGLMNVAVKYASGILKKRRDGSIETESKTRNKGCIREEFIEKHKISTNTTPSEYMELFLPFNNNMYNKKSGMDFPSFELVMKWTNLKAHLAGAGKGGTCYEDFTPFSVKEF